MKNTFIKTKNVKKLIALMEEVKTIPPKLPKMVLVYGEYGLGKSEAFLWWADKNDAVYVRANKAMTSRWLISEIVEELNESPFYHTQENFYLIENKLRQNPKMIIIDEVDYLIEKDTIETLRDLHDRTGCPIVLSGMAAAEKKLARYKHLQDRFYQVLHFEHFDNDDIKATTSELSDLEFTEEALQYIAVRHNQLRQLSLLINKIEKRAKRNNLKVIDENTLRGLLNERPNIKAVEKAQQVLVG